MQSAAARASASWITWALAACFVLLLDAGITRTPLLWGETRFEHTRDITQVAFAQTYQAARAIYAPSARAPIALIGDSRIWLGAPAPLVNRTLAGRGAPPVVNLGIFGAGLGDLEELARHLPRLAPSLAVLALGTSDLLGTPSAPLAGVASRLLRIGWSGGPLPDAAPADRLDRWLRTLWPLYRFREFSREVIDDRVLAGLGIPRTGAEAGDEAVSARGGRFDSTADFFGAVHGARGPRLEAAWRRWRERGTLAAFVDYVRALNPQYLELVQQRTRETGPIDPRGPAVKVLDALLARLAATCPTIVVLMPEHPVLAQDLEQRYHRAGFSDAAAAVVLAAGRESGVPVLDGRTWMPAESFLDFDHLMPDLGRFHERLAEEIARVLGV